MVAVMVLIFVLAIHLRKKDDASCQEKLAALEEEKKKLLSQVEPVQDKGPSRMTDFLEHSISTTMKYARAGAERAIMEVHFDLEVDQDGFCLRVPCYDDEDEYEEYRIVGSKEADPSNNKISNESPIALAIMNSKVGEIKKVTSPNGEYEVEIVEIC